MPTRKIRDLDEPKRCQDKEHFPMSSMRVYTPGVYEHVCPSCGKVTQFTVRQDHSWASSCDGLSGRNWNSKQPASRDSTCIPGDIDL